MRLDRPAIHSYGVCNFCVAAALQQQFNNLLLTRAKPHRFPPIHRAPLAKCNSLKPAPSRNCAAVP
jgi:hypothetical protein